MSGVNWPGVWAIFHHEMTRFFRTVMQSMLSPVVSTVLYFVVFGAAIGGRIQSVEGVEYGAFIVPGLMMLTILQQSVSNASFGIYFPKFSGTIYEYLVSPVGWIEVTLGFVGAAATKAVLIALILVLQSPAFARAAGAFRSAASPPPPAARPRTMSPTSSRPTPSHEVPGR